MAKKQSYEHYDCTNFERRVYHPKSKSEICVRWEHLPAQPILVSVLSQCSELAWFLGAMPGPRVHCYPSAVFDVSSFIGKLHLLHIAINIFNLHCQAMQPGQYIVSSLPTVWAVLIDCLVQLDGRPHAPTNSRMEESSQQWS